MYDREEVGEARAGYLDALRYHSLIDFDSLSTVVHGVLRKRNLYVFSILTEGWMYVYRNDDEGKKS